jgi:4-carboxymuconolactone decarboxylase
MALLPYADEAKILQKNREILNRGRVKLNIARMIANSDAAFYPFSMLGNSLLTRAKLDAKLREIAILRTAKVSHSNYEWTQHVPIAKAVGVSDEQIAAMDDPDRAGCFNEVERLVIKFTDEVARNVKGSPQLVEQLKKHMGTAEVVELILSIGFWGMVARVLETTEVDLEEFAGKSNLLNTAFARR